MLSSHIRILNLLALVGLAIAQGPESGQGSGRVYIEPSLIEQAQPSGEINVHDNAQDPQFPAADFLTQSFAELSNPSTLSRRSNDDPKEYFYNGNDIVGY